MKKFIYLFLLSVCSLNVNAAIVWDWSFGSNSGQLITDGVTVGGSAAANTYSITDFMVSSSGDGATIGSWLGGEYSASGYSTNTPYSLVWDGSNVSTWLSAGYNTFDWLVFDDLSNSNSIFFGWETGNINTVNQAGYSPFSTQSSLLSVSPVPAPAAIWLMLSGLIILLGMRKKFSKSSAKYA